MWRARVSGCGGCEFVVGLNNGQGPALALPPEKRKQIAVGFVQGWRLAKEAGQQEDKEHFYYRPWHPPGERANKRRAVMGLGELAEHWNTIKSPLSSNHVENKSKTLTKTHKVLRNFASGHQSKSPELCLD